MCRPTPFADELRAGAQRGGVRGFDLAALVELADHAVDLAGQLGRSQTAVTRLKELGADVLVHGDDWDGADRMARDLVDRDAAGYVPPFDHPLLWQGHASLVDEMATQGDRPDAVVVAVGGGGLFCGVAEGMERAGWADVPIIVVGAVGADAFDQSVRAGRLVELPAIRSVAKSLGARKIAQAALDWCGMRPVVPVVVSDRSAVDACVRFADQHQTLVEPACGAALSLVYDRHPVLAPYASITVVMCGGVGVSIPMLQGWEVAVR